MKNLIISLVLMLGASMSGMAQTDYNQWLVVNFKPKIGQEEMFKKGMAAHNKKYHTADPYKVGIIEVMTGPNSGEYTLIMGPMTFTQMEARKTSAEHDVDWDKNVLAYVESVGETSFWRAEKDVNYRPEGAGALNNSRLRFTTLLPGGWDRYKAQMEKIVAVYKAKKYNAAFDMYWRWGASTGPDVATQMSFNGWSFLDNDISFRKDYEDVHGFGSWSNFLDEIELCVDRGKTYDELGTYLPALSSD